MQPARSSECLLRARRLRLDAEWARPRRAGWGTLSLAEKQSVAVTRSRVPSAKVTLRHAGQGTARARARPLRARVELPSREAKATAWA